MYLLLFAGLGALAFWQKDAINEKVTELPMYWTAFDSEFKAAGARYGVAWQWLKAIALNESDLGRNSSVARGLSEPSDIEGSKSSDGLSWGLMQVTLRTGRSLDPACNEIKLNDAKYSINLAAKYLAQLKNSFPESDPRFLEWVVKSYNQGPGNSAKERAGKIAGYAQEYFNRFTRNLARVNER
jgi:membrane-bound lytic murein transglycosylase MltF